DHPSRDTRRAGLAGRTSTGPVYGRRPQDPRARPPVRSLVDACARGGGRPLHAGPRHLLRRGVLLRGGWGSAVLRARLRPQGRQGAAILPGLRTHHLAGHPDQKQDGRQDRFL
ncbi:MAG: hypothetical protein AVDCRST_MAG25-2561, partial [uncultured Rubrobacteraceae bacterium]